MGIGETLQTKAGPLPVWAWGVGGGVGLALLLRMRGAGGANPVGPVVLQPASMGGGLSVSTPAPTDQGTGGADLTQSGNLRNTTLANALGDPWWLFPENFNSPHMAPGSPGALGVQNIPIASPAPSPAQSAVVTVAPVSTVGATVLPAYSAALDRLRSFVGWDAQSRVNQWVNDAISNAKSRGQWGAGSVTDANLRAIALGGIKWQQEEYHLTDPTASGYDLSGFVSNTLNPGQAVEFLLAGGVPNRYALDYSRTSESGRPLTSTTPMSL